ncbi:hypothetical protein K2173_015067 [Erythroxylum novogranatense]|uniref:PIN-like protein n=1 Tax=Erythroxylum novogranatense TaxID=1862640 RepID=A0AAV8T2B5_9ROSI|nr:hypothetical protein K2173_015067 [Erythroxylum novogranatense]
MERLLSAVAVMEKHVGGESVWGTIKIAVLPIAKVFTMCLLGFLMASKYVNILPANGRKLLNGLVFSLLLPCLIFSQLGQAVTLKKMLEWWFIPMNVLLDSISGSIIGFVVASVVRPPYPFFKFTIIHIGIETTCSNSIFDIEDGHLPIKGPPKDVAPEQVPLLAGAEEETDSNASVKGKDLAIPAIKQQISSFSFGNALVIMSAPLSSLPCKLDYETILLQPIQALLQFAHKVFFSFHLEALRLFHVNLLLQITMKEGYIIMSTNMRNRIKISQVTRARMPWLLYLVNIFNGLILHEDNITTSHKFLLYGII